MLDQVSEPPPRQLARPTTKPEHIPRIQAVIVVSEVGFYRLRVVLEERAEAFDSGGVMP
jgi:hypothetical protein